MAQIILEDLPYKKRMEYLDRQRQQAEERSSIVSDLEKGSNKYEIIQNAQLLVLGKPITQTKIITEWEVAYKTSKTIEAQIKVINEVNQSEEWIELYHLMKKLTAPLQNIIFELSPQGYITNILNKNEILTNWDEIKKEFVDDSSFADVIKLGDADYSNPIVAIKKNIIYQLFFFSLYKKNFLINKKIMLEKNVKLQSIIFPDCNISADVEEIAYERVGDYILFDQYTKDENIRYNEINTSYKENYKPFIDKNTTLDNGTKNYSIGYRSKYRILAEVGKLIHCKATFSETVNQNLLYTSDIEIKLKS